MWGHAVRFLVTGGAGFIGSHLVDALVNQGREVLVIDSLEPQVHKRKPTYLNPSAQYVFKNILDEESLASCLREVDFVYHLASLVGVGQSMYQISRYVDVNVGGTARLLQLITTGDRAVRKVVVASSMSIYGEGAYECPSHGVVSPSLRSKEQLSRRDWEIHCPQCAESTRPVPTPESKPLMTNSVYAVTKRDQEEMCLSIGRAYELPTVALRFFNVYGPRQSLDNPYTGVAAIFQSRIKNGQPPVIFEDGLQTRDFVSVHDVVDALLRAANRPEADYQAINVGSGKPIAIRDVAGQLIEMYRSKVSPLVQNRFRAGDVRHCFAALDKGKELLDYHPRVTFASGMRELVHWASEAEAADHFDAALDELRSKGLING